MGIVSRITLKDDYSGKVDKISGSLSRFEHALRKSKAETRGLSSVLQSAFGRTYEVKMRQIKDRGIRRDLQKMQSDLRRVTDKPYQVKITARDTALTRAKRTATQLKDTLRNVGSGTKRIFVNASSLIKAKREARRLKTELNKSTGKRHKVKIAMSGEGKVFSIIDRIKNKFRDLRSSAKDSLSGIGGGSMFGSMLGANLVSAGITKAIGGITSMAGSVLEKGWTRLTSMDSAQARLRGYGHDDAAIESISQSSLSAVKGTKYGLDEAMMVSSLAVGAGVEQGEELDRYLQAVVGATAAAGPNAQIGELSSIFNKVYTSNRAQAEELNQIADRGIPIFQAIADVMDVDASEVKGLASQGAIDYAIFEQAITQATGSVADEMGKTVTGALSNVGASFGRIGAGLIGGTDGTGGIFGQLAPAFQSLIEKLGPLEDKAGEFGEKLGSVVSRGLENLGQIFEKLNPVLEGAKSIFEGVRDAIKPMLPALGQVAESLLPIFGAALSGLGTFISSVVAPAFSSLSDFIQDYVVPALDFLGGVLQDTVLPAFEVVADIVGGIVTTAFEILTGVLDDVIGAFGAVKGAVEGVIGFFSSLASGVDSGGLVPGGMAQYAGGNATGTDHFGGGWTAINERGAELVKLPKGAQIFPAGKSEEIVNRAMKQQTHQNTKSVVINPTIYITGSNPKENGLEVERALKRLAVNI